MIRFHHNAFPNWPRRPLVLAIALLAGMADAAVLGELQLRSHLGERFDAMVPVKGEVDDAIESACFKLRPAEGDDEAVFALRRARLIYHRQGKSAGHVQIVGDASLNEPILRFSLRLSCDNATVVSRDYSALLDPAPHSENAGGESPVVRVATVPENRQPALAASAAVPVVPPRPRPGDTLVTVGGETFDKLSRQVYHNKRRRQAVLQALLGAYPQFQANTPLPAGQTLQLPDRQQVANIVASLPPEPSVASSGKTQVMPPLKMTLPTVLPKAPQPNGEQKSEAGGRLILSEGGDSNMGSGDPLQLKLPTTGLKWPPEKITEDQRLKLREKLLLIDADDRTAELLELKHRTWQLEQQVKFLAMEVARQNALQANPASVPAASHRSNTLLYGLLALSTIMAALWIYERRRRREPSVTAEQLFPGKPTQAKASRRDGLEELDLLLEKPHKPSRRPPPADESHSRTIKVDAKEMAASQAPRVQPEDEAEDDGSHDNDLDVVQPQNVAEEAAMLVEAGLHDQAIELLRDEIATFPSKVVLWMQLFTLFRDNNMSAEFRRLAQAYRAHYSSASLWERVRIMGEQLDPEDPLYAPSQPTGLPAGETALADARPADEQLEWVRPALASNEEFPLADKPLPLADEAVQPIEIAMTVPGGAPGDSSFALEFEPPSPLPALTEAPRPLSESVPEIPELDFPDPVPQAAKPQMPGGFVPASIELALAESPETINRPRLREARLLLNGGQRDAAIDLLEHMLLDGDWVEKNEAIRILTQLRPVA